MIVDCISDTYNYNITGIKKATVYSPLRIDKAKLLSIRYVVASNLEFECFDQTGQGDENTQKVEYLFIGQYKKERTFSRKILFFKPQTFDTNKK